MHRQWGRRRWHSAGDVGIDDHGGGMQGGEMAKFILSSLSLSLSKYSSKGRITAILVCVVGREVYMGEAGAVTVWLFLGGCW